VRRTTIATGVAIIGLGLTLAACNDGTASVNSTPDKTTAAAAAPSSKTPTKAAPKKPAPAKIGDTITLHGMEGGSQLAVTMVKWVDPAKGADEYTTPDSGKRFVAVQVRIVNTGKGVYDDSPSNGIQVADTKGQRFDSDFNEVSAGPSMAPEVKLRPGDKALGYITFQVPKASRVAQVQFSMDSGFADEAGQWNVG